MASISKLAEILLDLSTGRNVGTQAASPSGVTTAKSTTAGIEDQFTLSGQGATQAAGINAAQSVALSSAATQLLPNAIPKGAAALAVQTTATPLTLVVANNAALQKLDNSLEAVGLNTADISKINGIASLINNFDPAAFAVLAQQLKAQELAPGATPIPSASAAINNPSTASSPFNTQITARTLNSVNTDEALQKLDNSLERVGLNNADISKINGIASLINNFDPAAFAVLAYQLKAQEVAPQAATKTTVPAQIVNPTT